jgi:acetylornithine deacetylase/succinyl-diaminopimelate desuccinylase-like protein
VRSARLKRQGTAPREKRGDQNDAPEGKAIDTLEQDDAQRCPGRQRRHAATDSQHHVGVTDKIFRFSPVRANGEDLTRFHGTSERVSIEGDADMIRFYRRPTGIAAG